MKSWIAKHQASFGWLIVIASVVTFLYGLGHIIAAFGGQFGWLTPGRSELHLFVGFALLLAGSVSFFAGRRLEIRDELEGADSETGRRRRASRAIWERARRNKLEENQRPTP